MPNTAQLDAQRDFGHKINRPEGRSDNKYSFRSWLWHVAAALRNKERWSFVCASADVYHRGITGYRKTLCCILDEKGKDALNRQVAFMGFSIAECDELLGLCFRLRLLKRMKQSLAPALVERRGNFIDGKRKEQDRADLSHLRASRSAKYGN